MARYKSTTFADDMIKSLKNNNMSERIPTEKLNTNGNLSKNNEKTLKKLN